jgi:hypothetical protein
MTRAPKKPAKDVSEAESPIYLIFEDAQDEVGGGITVRELDEIDEIGQMVSDIPDEETPVFFTCT